MKRLIVVLSSILVLASCADDDGEPLGPNNPPSLSGTYTVWLVFWLLTQVIILIAVGVYSYDRKNAQNKWEWKLYIGLVLVSTAIWTLLVMLGYHMLWQDYKRMLIPRG